MVARVLVRIIVGRRRGAVVAITRESTQAGELNMLNKGAGDFPDQIYDFHANYGRPLKALRFVAHGLDRFPERAGKELTQLTQLTLASNRLTALPDSICDLANLSSEPVAEPTDTTGPIG